MQGTLDLSSAHISSWRSMLPPDVRSALKDDATPDGDHLAASIILDFQQSAPRRMLEVLDTHAEAFSRMGQSRRVRFMSWAMNRSWPDTGFARDLLASAKEGEGESDSGGGREGRGKVAPLFLADYRAIKSVVRQRIVHSVQNQKLVEALHNGVKSFNGEIEIPSSGGF